MLGIFYTARGDEPQAVGWLGRAGRLAKDIPESTAHGYLINFTVVEASVHLGAPWSLLSDHLTLGAVLKRA